MLEAVGIGAVFVALAATLMLLASQMIASVFFARWAYALGPVMWRTALPTRLPGLDVPSSGETASTTYRVLPGGVCLFRRRRTAFGLHTALEPLGTLQWQSGQMIATARIPLGLLLFQGAWLLGVLTGIAVAASQGGGAPMVLQTLLLAGVGLITWVSWRIETARLAAEVAQLAEALGVAVPPSRVA